MQSANGSSLAHQITSPKQNQRNFYAFFSNEIAYDNEVCVIYIHVPVYMKRPMVISLKNILFYWSNKELNH